MAPATKRKIFTIGHSTSEIEDFIKSLKVNGIKILVDIRTAPGSRHNPQYNQEDLEKFLKKRGIDYIYLKELGGFRKPKENSSNMGWENPSFRGYADYMATPDFESGLSLLEETAMEAPTAIMCAEFKPWECHRMLVADALTIRKWKVYHIKNSGKAALHKLTPFLRVRRGKIIYPLIKENI